MSGEAGGFSSPASPFFYFMATDLGECTVVQDLWLSLIQFEVAGLHNS